jgi:hypothetical protein
MFPHQLIIKGELLMKNVFKHRLNKRNEVREFGQLEESIKYDADLKHDRLKDSALINYYMMGGY